MQQLPATLRPADCGGDEVDASATSHAAGSTAAAVAAGGNTVYQFRPQVQVWHTHLSALIISACSLLCTQRISAAIGRAVALQSSCNHNSLAPLRTAGNPDCIVSCFLGVHSPCVCVSVCCCSLLCLMIYQLIVLRHWLLGGPVSQVWWCVHHCWTMCQTLQDCAGKCAQQSMVRLKSRSAAT